jgi:hypothetical protein
MLYSDYLLGTCNYKQFRTHKKWQVSIRFTVFTFLTWIRTLQQTLYLCVVSYELYACEDIKRKREELLYLRDMSLANGCKWLQMGCELNRVGQQRSPWLPFDADCCLSPLHTSGGRNLAPGGSVDKFHPHLKIIAPERPENIQQLLLMACPQLASTVNGIKSFVACDTAGALPSFAQTEITQISFGYMWPWFCANSFKCVWCVKYLNLFICLTKSHRCHQVI